MKKIDYSWEKVFPHLHPDEKIHVNRRIRDGMRLGHQHDYFEFILVLKGNGNLRTLLGIEKLRPHQMLLFPPGTWHSFEDCSRLHLLFCSVHQDFLLKDLFHFQKMGSHFLRLITDAQFTHWSFLLTDQKAKTFLNNLEKIKASPHPQSPRFLKNIGHFLVFLSGFMEQLPSKYTSLSSPRPLHSLTIRALEIFEKNPSCKISLRELAQKLNDIHPSHLSKIFRRDTGYAPIAYRIRRSLEKSTFDLICGEKSIGEIAFGCGYEDQNLFSRNFKKSFGVSPTEYVQNYVNKKRF